MDRVGSQGDAPDRREDVAAAAGLQNGNGAETSWFTFTLDREGKVFSVSKAFDRSFPGGSHNLIGKDLQGFVHGEDWPKIDEALAALGSEESSKVTARLLIPGSEPIPFELSLAQLTDGNSIIGINILAKAIHRPSPVLVPLASLITEEDALGPAESAMMVLDPQGKITVVDESTAIEMGFTADELRGKKLSELVASDQILEGSVDKVLANALAGTRVTVEVPIRARDGNAVRFLWRFAPLWGDNGDAIGVAIGGGTQSNLLKMRNEADGLQNLEALAEASTDLVQSDDLADTIDRDLDKLIESLGIEYAVFRLLAAESKPRMVCAGIDFKGARRLLESRIVGAGQLYVTVQEGKPFISLDIRSDPRIEVEDAEIRALACLPIRSRREIYGCALFASKRLTGITQAKLPILQVFSNQVGISVRKARLKRELQLRNRERETLYETTAAITQCLEFPKVLYTILSKASDLVKADRASMFSLDKQTRRLRCVANISEYHLEGHELKLGEGITGLVAQKGEGMLIERADRDERAKQVDGTPDEPSSLISVPLRMGDEVLGVMTLEKVPGTPFNTADYRLIEMFSAQAAIAINNASLFNQIQEHASAQQMYNILLTHDVANYNVPIHGYLEMLAKDPKLDDRQRKFVIAALAQSENISGLIADVRKLSLIRTLDTMRDFKPVDVGKVVQECIDSLRMNTLYEDIEIRYSPPQQAAMVLGDAMIKDIAYNLLSNACKYGGKGPVEVEVGPYEEASKMYWRIDIRDRGDGVPEQRREFLFKRFDQVDVGAAAEGHGIGLSVVAALVQRFAGRVWVEDREGAEEIKGSVFIVILPQVKV
ncbi:MAG: GAF domain-containing protein [Methanomassiliicoccales archaeon]|nr:GAF domain-containing protein [Methanomassiliicoccales archaeon]